MHLWYHLLPYQCPVNVPENFQAGEYASRVIHNYVLSSLPDWTCKNLYRGTAWMTKAPSNHQLRYNTVVYTGEQRRTPPPTSVVYVPYTSTKSPSSSLWRAYTSWSRKKVLVATLQLEDTVLTRSCRPIMFLSSPEFLLPGFSVSAIPMSTNRQDDGSREMLSAGVVKWLLCIMRS